MKFFNFLKCKLSPFHNIRVVWIQEETIIFALIERAQYRRNHDIYDAKKIRLRDVYGAPLSFLEWMLIETEKLHAKVRRYTSPEEHAFYEERLPPPILEALQFPQLLAVNKSDVQVNAEIMRWYTAKIIDRLCVEGDDEQHGSSVLCDINALQALSRRIHMGKFVAESKFQEDPQKYTEVIERDDPVAVLELLTNKEVERLVLRRAFYKASAYGQDITASAIDTGADTDARPCGTNNGFPATRITDSMKVDPMLIADLYRDMIIPLTKDVELRYLYHRVGRTPPVPEMYYHHCRAPKDAFDNDKQPSPSEGVSI